MPLRWMLILVLELACCSARQPAKPPCNAKNQGEVWPAPKARAACVPVEICTLEVWKYRWEPATVDVSRMAKDQRRRLACSSDEDQVPLAANVRRDVLKGHLPEGGSGRATADR